MATSIERAQAALTHLAQTFTELEQAGEFTAELGEARRRVLAGLCEHASTAQTSLSWLAAVVADQAEEFDTTAGEHLGEAETLIEQAQYALWLAARALNGWST